MPAPRTVRGYLVTLERYWARCHAIEAPPNARSRPRRRIRADAETDQLEVAAVHDNSLGLGDVPENTTRRLVSAADFRPWPQQTVFIGGQPFVYQWARGHATCARCNVELEHFAYSGMPGGDVREHGQGSGPPI